MFYSLPWLQMVGFLEARETGGGDKAIAPPGQVRSHPGTALGPILVDDNGQQPTDFKEPEPNVGNGAATLQFVPLITGILIGSACTVGAMSLSLHLRKPKHREGYLPINGNA
jgi:hypothetical protein